MKQHATPTTTSRPHARWSIPNEPIKHSYTPTKFFPGSCPAPLVQHKAQRTSELKRLAPTEIHLSSVMGKHDLIVLHMRGSKT